MGNGWAAGAGRLQGPVGPLDIHAGSSSSSNDSAVAARMLAVQYARAARRQYNQVSFAGVHMHWLCKRFVQQVLLLTCNNPQGQQLSCGSHMPQV
jgi:hypothetical protein